MSGGSNIRFPEQSPQEEALRAEQVGLLRNQRDILQKQEREQALVAPLLWKEAGVTPQYDETGQLTGFTPVDDPNKAMTQEIQQRLQQRTLAALKGELPDDPGLLRDLAERDRTMQETLRRNLGPGWQTGTAGQNALTNLAESKQNILTNFRRGELSLAESLGLARQASNENLTNAALARLTGVGQNPLATAGAFGQAAAGYSNPLQQLLAVRQGRMSAAAQREAMNQAETGMYLGFASDVIGSVASAVPAMTSSARFKKDIAPFDVGEYGSAMKKLRDTPITRWRYKWEGDDHPLHTGPILELAPKEIGVGDGTHVDLLNYAGMLHAGLKSVDRDVRTLRQALAEG